MKYKLLLFFALLSSICQAQIVSIPDANFMSKLMMSGPTEYSIARDLAGNPVRIDSNWDFKIDYSEAAMIGYMDVSGCDIQSMTGIEAFVNLRELFCDDNYSINLDVAGLIHLEKLNCEMNQITELNVSAMTNLIELRCGANQLSSLDVSGLASLKILNCGGNNITDINLSGADSIEILFCGTNQLTAIDLTDQTNLRELYSNANSLTELSFIAPLLKILYCGNNDILELNALQFPLLEELDCRENQISGLDLDGLINLEHLECRSNLITGLNLEGLISLKHLECRNNQIADLNLLALPSLEFLSCGENQLQALEIAGLTNLESLSCSQNQISALELTNLPQLNVIQCADNLLQEFDASELSTLSQLNIMNNPLISMNLKNGSRESSLIFSGCPDLQYICTDQDHVNGVNYKISQYGYANCYANSFCTFTPGGEFYTLGGSVNVDVDANGCDTADIPFPNLNFTISNESSTETYFADHSGNYSLPLQADTYTITPVLENGSYFNINPSTLTVELPEDGSSVIQDFCLIPNGEHHDLEVNINPIGPARPGFAHSYFISVRNKGTEVQSGSVSFTFDDDVMDFVSSGDIVVDVFENSVIWTFDDLQPVGGQVIMLQFILNSPVDSPPLNSGDILTATATISSNPDETPNDNTFSIQESVVNSFDPNDITCLEGPTVGSAQIGEYVHYLIRFENTGTANAQHVFIEDILDWEKFSPGSLVPVSSSHTFETRIYSDYSVHFIFRDIDLPFDDVNNDGWVLFKVRLNPDLAVGDTFSNSAKIYFDFNAPVETNEYVTTISALNVPEVSQSVAIYPNPVKNVLNFDSAVQITNIDIYDISGRILKTKRVDSNQIDISELSTGHYIVRFTTAEGPVTIKILKQ